MNEEKLTEKRIASYQMSFADIEENVESLCRKHHVEHLYLFGSYAKGTAVKTSGH